MTNRAKSLSALVIIAGFAGLAACAGTPSHIQSSPTHRINPTTVAESVERLELYSRPNGFSLSARDQAAVTAFLQGYATRGNGPIFINRPAGYARGLGVQETDAVLRNAMLSLGLNPASPQSGEYHVRPGDPAPVVVSYKTLRTVAQDCSAYAADLSDLRYNGTTPSFGCFASANLAEMISDPRQLIEPLPPGTPNAQRRQVIFDRYIQGASTASSRNSGQQQSSQSTG